MVAFDLEPHGYIGPDGPVSKTHSNLITDLVLLAMLLPLVGWRVLAVGAMVGLVVDWPRKRDDPVF